MRTDDDRDYTEDPVVTDRDALAKECDLLSAVNAELRAEIARKEQVIINLQIRMGRDTEERESLRVELAVEKLRARSRIAELEAKVDQVSETATEVIMGVLR